MPIDKKQHELKRIRSMTDKELFTRYGKMTVPTKILAFHSALCDENRCERLREKIEKQHGIPPKTKGVVHQVWYVRKDNDMYSFQKHDDYNIKVLRWEMIGVFESSHKERWSAHDVHEDYVNGYYPTDQGRLFWDKKISEGYTQFDPQFPTDMNTSSVNTTVGNVSNSNYALSA